MKKNYRQLKYSDSKHKNSKYKNSDRWKNGTNSGFHNNSNSHNNFNFYNNNALLNVVINIVLTLLFSVSFLFNKNEYVATTIILILTAIIFLIKYENGEWIIFAIGIGVGIFLEFGGDMIYKLQYWESGSFFGIPLWLPLFWGYAFVLINRIGRLVVKEKK